MVRSVKKEIEMLEKRNKILEFCSSESKSLSEISEYLNMNRHTVRTSYLYRMVDENLLNIIQKNDSKTSVSYKSR